MALELEYEFRPLTEDKLESVKLLHSQLLPINYSDTFYKALLNGLYKCLLLYEKDGNVLIGVSSWKLQYRETENENSKIKVGYLATFGIRTSFRRRGLGKYLLICTLSMMQDMDCQMSELHVLSTNIAAKNLYIRCGYFIKMKLPNHYHFNDKTHDAFLLIKSLTSKHCDADNQSESKSEYDKNERERSPPYYEEDENEKSIDSLDESIINISNDDAHSLPISNWTDMDSLWIKCTLL